jgi:hypothetical protein
MSKKLDWLPEPIDAPEGWEEKRRAELEAELPDGCYDHSMPGFTLIMGKGGHIQLQIALEKALKGYK